MTIEQEDKINEDLHNVKVDEKTQIVFKNLFLSSLINQRENCNQESSREARKNC